MSRRRAQWLSLVALALAACQVRVAAPDPREEVSVEEIRRFWYPGQKVLRTEYGVQVAADGEVKLHGADREWYPDGTRKSERHHEAGRDVGVWREWYEDGTPRSEVDLGDGIVPAPMTFWHENGGLAARGPGLAGVREGEWEKWYDNGQPEARGEFRAARRHGVWELFDRAGRPRARGRYRDGERVGVWELLDEEGHITEKSVGELPPELEERLRQPLPPGVARRPDGGQ